MAYTTDVATAHKHAHGHGHGGGHDNLIREAEAEMNELSWGELMLAGGLAGMVSWTVSQVYHYRYLPMTMCRLATQHNAVPWLTDTVFSNAT
jgi:hypothetical protein